MSSFKNFNELEQIFERAEEPAEELVQHCLNNNE